MFFAEVDQRVNRVTWFGQVKFDIRSFDLEVIVHGSPDHIVAVKFMKESFAWFEGILRRDHHPHLLEVSGFRHDVRDDEMPNMNGVKRAEEQTYFQGLCIF